MRDNTTVTVNITVMIDDDDVDVVVLTNRLLANACADDDWQTNLHHVSAYEFRV